MDDIRIDRTTAHQLVRDGALLVDVRTEEEFAQGALPTAINVPVQVIAQTIQDHATEEQTLVLYCVSGARSHVAAMMLRSFGYAKSYNLGGLDDW
ncbi:MAG: rhodanese-like domain-containing protein [Myxococcota bacterium]